MKSFTYHFNYVNFLLLKFMMNLIVDPINPSTDQKWTKFPT